MKQIDPYIKDAGIAIPGEDEKYNLAHDRTGKFASGGGGSGKLSVTGSGSEGQLTDSQVREVAAKLSDGDKVTVTYRNGREILDTSRGRLPSASGRGTGNVKWSQPQKMTGIVKKEPADWFKVEDYSWQKGTITTVRQTRSGWVTGGKPQHILKLERAE